MIKNRWKFTTLAYVIVVACWVIYAALTLFAPQAASDARYHIGGAERILLDLTIIIPIHLIWLMAVSGATSFKNYALMLKGSREASGINFIADGLFWTLGYFVISGLASSIASYFLGTHYYNIAVIIKDHIAPAVSLVAFFVLLRGSQQLRQVAPFSTWSRNTTIVVGIFGIISAMFVYDFATSSPLAQAGMQNSLDMVPHHILLFTLVLPYLVAWYMGLLACVNITKYAAHVKGLLYRRALRDLVWGISGVIVFVIVIQLISFAGHNIASLPFANLLAIVYALLLLYGLGFLFVRAGAKKLSRIEVAM